MTQQLKQLADMCEKMAALNFSKQPNFCFMEDLIGELMKQGVPVTAASDIVARMKVSISSYDSDNADWKRIVSSYGSMIIQLRSLFSESAMKSVAGQLSITYEF